MPIKEGATVRYITRVVGSLPLVRGLLRRMRIQEIIDRVCPANPQTLLSYGEVTEVLVANRLSSPRPLYEVQKWGHRAGVRQVYGIDPDRLNDDRLGRTLDVLAQEAGRLKGEICLGVAQEYGVGLEQLHYDLTTVYVEGEYAREEPEAEAIRILYTKDNSREAAGKGFRVGVSTFNDGKGAVSLLYQALSGTVGTAEGALQNMRELRGILGQRVDRVIEVSDRAGVTAEVVAQAKEQGFDLLGPLAMNLALKRRVRELLGQNPPWEQMSYVSGRQARKPLEQQERYRAFEVPTEFEHEGQKYPVRLMVVYSEGKRARDQKTREKRQKKIEKELEGLRQRVGRPRWPMAKIQAKVRDVLQRSAEGEFYEVIWEGPEGEPTGFTWRGVSQKVQEAQDWEGIYTAATTLPPERYPLDDVFTRLKHQYLVEDSHRILKGPIRISPVFLHTPKRIEGLIFVLWLALVAYQLLEREFRQRAWEEEMKEWTSRTLLKVFEMYSYIGIRRGEEIQWVPSELSEMEQEVYGVLGLSLPAVDTS